MNVCDIMIILILDFIKFCILGFYWMWFLFLKLKVGKSLRL